MKILFHKAYYYPEISSSQYLTENLVEDLAAAGHEVKIYAPIPSRGISP